MRADDKIGKRRFTDKISGSVKSSMVLRLEVKVEILPIFLM